MCRTGTASCRCLAPRAGRSRSSGWSSPAAPWSGRRRRGRRDGRRRLGMVARDPAEGFVPLAERWIVARPFARLGRCRRLAKAFENWAVNALAFLCLGMIRLVLRRLARASADWQTSRTDGVIGARDRGWLLRPGWWGVVGGHRRRASSGSSREALSRAGRVAGRDRGPRGRRGGPGRAGGAGPERAGGGGRVPPGPGARAGAGRPGGVLAGHLAARGPDRGAPAGAVPRDASRQGGDGRHGEQDRPMWTAHGGQVDNSPRMTWHSHLMMRLLLVRRRVARTATNTGTLFVPAVWVSHGA